MQKLLIILGPTAVGKTNLAIKLAKQLSGELIACDSRQVYKNLDIVTNKLPGEGSEYSKGEGFWVVDKIKVHLYDLVSVMQQFSVFDFVQNANKKIDEVATSGKLPIVVGGTGLYIKGLLGEIENLNAPRDENLRKKLEKLEIGELQNRLRLLSPTGFEAMNNSDRNNRSRLTRKIELVSMYGYIPQNKISKIEYQKFDILKVGLCAPRPYLNEKINQKVFSWISQGAVLEVQTLLQSGVSYQRLQEIGLGYAVIGDFLQGRIKTETELVKKLQEKTRQYAKRQMTWFKKENGVVWFDAGKEGWEKKVEKKVIDWYNTRDGKKD